MIKTLFVSAATAVLLLFAAAAPAQADNALSAEQRKAVQEEIRAYILSNPEVVLEALQTMQQRERQAEAERQKKAIGGLHAALAESPLLPVIGNPDGDVTVVEFFDYNCGYCKSVVDRLANRIEADPKLKVVMVEFPILGEASVYAARVALAAEMQGKYEDFHFALMRARGRLSVEKIRATAEDVGLDWATVVRDMKAPEVERTIQRNYELADALGVSGTPAFVIGDELVPGAIDEDAMARLIERARQG